MNMVKRLQKEMDNGFNLDITIIIDNNLSNNKIFVHDDFIMVNDYTAEQIRLTQVNIIRENKLKKILNIN